MVAAMAMMQQEAVGQELEADMGASGPMLIQTLEVMDWLITCCCVDTNVVDLMFSNLKPYLVKSKSQL